ncbi:MAG: nuclear transport factor 2 family protein [Acidimicrobiales bacterium]
MPDALQELLDRQAIVDLTIAYGWILDHGPREDLRNVFTEDAVAIYVGRTFEGVDSIISKVDQSLGRLSISQHLVSNQQVDIDGDSAKCRCYLQAQHTLHGTEGGDNFIMAGRYEDDVVRTPSGWRISRRELIIDWTEGNRRVTKP